MKAVLISIQPKWCELIANGKKTVEVRKTKPKLETPFKCYIYCTQGKFSDLGIIGNEIYQKRMKVIGEFVCDMVIRFENEFYEPAFNETSYLSCMDYDEIARYLDYAAYGYGWHITDLVIYDEPRELGEFVFASTVHTDCFGKCTHRVTRPPQSWCYVEGV